MRKEEKYNKYTVYYEVVFVNKIDVCASNENEAKKQVREMLEDTEEKKKKLLVSDSFYRVKAVELKEKNVKKEKTVIFIYEDE